jgi:beta-lactamase class A
MDHKKLVMMVGGLGIGLFLGYVLFGHKTITEEITSVRETAANYSFINPLLFVQVPEQVAFPEYQPLHTSLENYRTKALHEEKANEISIYFRDLNESKWIGINETATFSPASMLKVVTLISTLREAETDPKLLHATAYITGKGGVLPTDIQTYYPPKDPVVIGHTYTVDQLLQHLIVDSDNIANNALYEIIGADNINKTYQDLELPTPDEDGAKNYTPQQYSHLFRALYNGTYLSKKISEQVLELLSKTYFDKGLVAGVPTGTIVSHKFGVRNILTDGAKPTDEPTARELHDCGIVYYPNNPYFLCVMTRGKDFPTLEGVIKDISKIAWDEVSKMK